MISKLVKIYLGLRKRRSKRKDFIIQYILSNKLFYNLCLEDLYIQLVGMIARKKNK